MSWFKERRAVLALLVVAGFALGGCGFHPLYADRTGGAPVKAKLQNVSVSAPGTSYGRNLKFTLEDLMGAAGNQGTRYQLSLNPTIYETDIAVQQDTEVTRSNIRMTTPFSLYDQELGEVVFKGTALSVASYNRVDSEFANVIATRDAEERVSNDTARDIYTRLSIFFERQGRS